MDGEGVERSLTEANYSDKKMSKESLSTIEKRIFFTVSYFNLLEYAPTTFEIWRHLLGEEKNSLFFVGQSLERLKTKAELFEKNGFWFLSGKEALIGRRNRGKKISTEKMKRMAFWVKLLRQLPFLRGVFVRGAVALGLAERNSDWDVLIVTKKQRIWLARFLLMIFLEIFRKRRSGRNERRRTKDRFCLNHFLTEEGLILEKQNQFIAHEEGFSFPLMGGVVHKKFLNLNLIWLKKKRANFVVDGLDPFWLKKEGQDFPWAKKYTELFLEKTGLADGLNRLLRLWMIRLIKNNPKTFWPKADIRYSDQAMIFIPNPWRDGLEKQAEELISRD